MLKCCLLPGLALKRQMHSHSPPHVPALFIYPTIQGMHMLCVLYVQINILCSQCTICTLLHYT